MILAVLAILGLARQPGPPARAEIAGQPGAARELVTCSADATDA
jgi:hypothetical protein